MPSKVDVLKFDEVRAAYGMWMRADRKVQGRLDYRKQAFPTSTHSLEPTSERLLKHAVKKLYLPRPACAPISSSQAVG